jgi:hypothetical protein
MAEFRIGETVRSPEHGVGTIVAVLDRGVEIQWERAYLDDPWAADVHRNPAQVRTWRAAWRARPWQRFVVVEVPGGGYAVDDTGLVLGGVAPGVMTLEGAREEARWRNAR